MKMYLIMLPFLALFLYSGFRWHAYSEQLNSIDTFSENALYASVDINKLRSLDTDITTKNIGDNILKYMTLQMPRDIDGTIGYEIASTEPMVVKVEVSTMFDDSDTALRKTYILDSTE